MYSMVIFAVYVLLAAIYMVIALAFPGKVVFSLLNVDLMLWALASPIMMIPAMVCAYIEEKISDLINGY